MALIAKKLSESTELSVDELALIEHIAEILAEEYVTLLRKEGDHESSDLCALLKREPKGTEHR